MNSKLPRFSASKITIYLECKTQYAARYVYHLPPAIESTYAILGIGVHSAIEAVYMRGEFPYDVFDEIVNTRFKAFADTSFIGYSRGEVQNKGYAILDNYDYDMFSPIAMEKEFLLPFPEHNPICMMHGFIDMVTADGKVIDFKTNSKPHTKKAVNSSVQLAIYYWAYNQIYGSFPEQVAIYHLPTMRLIPADLHELSNVGLGVVETVQEMIDYVPPSKEELEKCSKCSIFCAKYGE